MRDATRGTYDSIIDKCKTRITKQLFYNYFGFTTDDDYKEHIYYLCYDKDLEEACIEAYALLGYLETMGDSK